MYDDEVIDLDGGAHEERPKVAATFEVGEELAYRLLEAQQVYDDANRYLKEVKDEVKGRCHDFDKAIGMFDGEKLFTYERREYSRCDTKRLKRDYPDIHQAYVTTKTTAYLTVARPKADS